MELPMSGIGAVLVEERGCKIRFFSEKLIPDLLASSSTSGRKTIIFECEFFALLCALSTLKDDLFRRNVVLHTDNDAVRDSFISCTTSSANAIPILNVV